MGGGIDPFNAQLEGRVWSGCVTHALLKTVVPQSCQKRVKMQWISKGNGWRRKVVTPFFYAEPSTSKAPLGFLLL